MQEENMAVCHYEKQKQLTRNTHIMIPRREQCKSAYDILHFCTKLSHTNVLLKNKYGHVLCTNIESMKELVSSAHLHTFFIEESLVHTQRHLMQFTCYRMMWDNNMFCFDQRMIRVNALLPKSSNVLSIYAQNDLEHNMSKKKEHIYKTLVDFIRNNHNILGKCGYMNVCYLHDTRKICIPDIYCRVCYTKKDKSHATHS